MTLAAGDERSHPGTGCGCTAPSEKRESVLNCGAPGRDLGRSSTECPRWCTACGCLGQAPGGLWWGCTGTDSRCIAPLAPSRCWGGRRNSPWFPGLPISTSGSTNHLISSQQGEAYHNTETLFYEAFLSLSFVRIYTMWHPRWNGSKWQAQIGRELVGIHHASIVQSMILWLYFLGK